MLTLPWAGAAAALVLASALVGAAWVLADPEAGARLVPVDLRRDIADGLWSAPIGPLAAVAAFATATAGLVPAGIVLAWVGLELGGSVALAAEAGQGPDVLFAVMAAAPLLSALVVATAAGADAGWAVVRGRAEWSKRVAVGAQVLIALVPLLVVGALFNEQGSSGFYGLAALLMVASPFWIAALRLGTKQ